MTACSGIEVKDIRVQIESSGPEAKESLYAIEPPSAKALPGSVGAKEEEPQEKPKKEPETISSEELKEVLAETPAPHPSDEEEVPQVEVSAAAAAAAEMLKNEALADEDEDDDRPIHQRLFSSPEEPCVMPMPPEEDKPEEKPEEKEPAEAGTAAAEDNKAEDAGEEEKKEGGSQEGSEA